MLVADRLLLLGFSPESGRLRSAVRPAHFQRALIAALVAELGLMRRVRMVEGRIEVSDFLPLSHPLLREVADQLSHHAGGEPAQRALALLDQRLGQMARRLADGLFRRDILHSDLRWRFLLWPRRVHPLRSRQARNECLALLQPMAVDSPAVAVANTLLVLSSAAGVLDAMDASEMPEGARRRGVDAIAATIADANRDPHAALLRELVRYVRAEPGD